MNANGHSILLASHQGVAGEIEPDELWRTVPSWRALRDVYEPDATAVAALSAIDRDVDVTVVFGTWCGDSKNYVPKIVKTLETVANPHLRLRLVSLRRGFAEPLDFTQENALTNVPTMLVHVAGKEIGRTVETPATESFEADLAAILDDDAPVHRGRWSRDAVLLTGVYEHKSAAGTVETEEWTLWADGEEKLYHSVRGATGNVAAVRRKRRADVRRNHPPRGRQRLSFTQPSLDEGRRAARRQPRHERYR